MPYSADKFDKPYEPACIQAPVVLSQMKTRKCVTRNIALMPAPDNDHPVFTLKRAENFKITDLNVLAKSSSQADSDEKSVVLLAVIRYDLIYSDGLNDLVQPDEARFELPIDNIKYPDCSVKLFYEDNSERPAAAGQTEKIYFTADALAETFGEMICTCTGALIMDLGVFFIIRSKCITQMSVPAVFPPLRLP